MSICNVPGALPYIIGHGHNSLHMRYYHPFFCSRRNCPRSHNWTLSASFERSEGSLSRFLLLHRLEAIRQKRVCALAIT